MTDDQRQGAIEALQFIWQITQQAAQPAQVHMECQKSKDKILACLEPPKPPAQEAKPDE